ncbi:hypothetical protein Q3G72_000856 [Acer saccharum]|nr:hypothetical protein Q3G72_000856 [Acer saccharum]
MAATSWLDEDEVEVGIVLKVLDLKIDETREVWSSSINGVYKANCDAVVYKNRGFTGTGIGIVIWDSKGEVFASCVQTLEAKLSIKASKIIVIVRSIQFALDCGMEPCVFETDEATIVKWIKEGSHRSSDYGVLLEDISSLRRMLKMVNFSHTRGSDNVVARGSAKHALDITLDTFWMEESLSASEICRSGSSEAPQKVSPRPVRQLNTSALETKSASPSNQTIRTPKDKSPKVVERRSPRSPVAVSEKKRPSKISELEARVSQLQEDLKKANDQLSSSESWKKLAQQDAEDSKKQLSAMSSKLEESQKQLLELSTSEEARVIELQKISQERDQAWQSELEAIQKQHSIDSAALVAAVNEIQQLKARLEMVAEPEDVQAKYAESADPELLTLKGNLVETLALVENMKNQLRESKESESQAQALANETLTQLESAKRFVEALRADGTKAIEAYNSISSELDQSRAHVNLLEGIVSKLEADLDSASRKSTQNSADDNDREQDIEENQKTRESDQLQVELYSLKSEVGRLRSALEIAEARLHEEQIQSTVQIKSANELEAELRKTKSDIEELKANLMDKETELQGISEENEGLQQKLEKTISGQRQSELDNEVRKLKETVSDLKANLMDKETELQNISEENEMLKLDSSKRETGDVEAARAAEREALVKLGLAMEEADKSNRRAARVAEQLDAAQAANSEAESELRRLKVQSDQWRKAAEAAAAMLSAGNNGKVMERTGSLDSNYNSVAGKINSPYSEDMDDDLLKKKNGNVLKKIGVLWKKPQK